MSLVSRSLRQQLVYWPLEGVDNDGQPTTFGPPVQLPCRLEEGASEVKTAQDERLQTSAHGYMTALDGSVTSTAPDPVLGSFVLEVGPGLPYGGLLSSMSGANPRDFGARELVHLVLNPDIRNAEKVREFHLGG